MIECVYQHIGDDGVVICDNYSNYAHGIITFCNQKNGCVGKKPTNADRIRAMNDEELADLFTRIDAFYCPVKGADCAKEPSCKDCFSRWLKQPVTEPTSCGNWIPVEERLPSESGNYLIVVSGTTELDYYSERIGWDCEGVTHWMPLPEPPEGSR